MDKRGLKTSLVVSIIVMCVLAVYLLFYIVNLYDYSIDNTKSEIIENSNNLDVLYFERLVDSFNNNCIDMKPFYTGKTLISDVDSNILLTTILNMNNNYNKKYLEKEYKKLFNKDIVIDKVVGTCPKIEYNGNNIKNLVCNCNVEKGVVTKFIKSIKTKSMVKLYYKVAFYSSKKYLGNTTKLLSKDAFSKEIIDSRVISKNVKEINYQEYLNNNYNDFYTYVYTFKFNNNNYYFYSITRE